VIDSLTPSAYGERDARIPSRSGTVPTDALAREFVAAGFEARLACVDPAQLDPSFAGRPFDERLLVVTRGGFAFQDLLPT
jgi:hypothetical protein